MFNRKNNNKNNKKLIFPRSLQALALCLLINKKLLLITLRYHGQMILILIHLAHLNNKIHLFDFIINILYILANIILKKKCSS